MKYLSDYTEEKQTAAFEKAGAFFAFSNQQFDEKKKEGIKYMSLGAGLISPEDTATQLVDDLGAIVKEATAQDIAENGVKAIIHREFANHECQLSGDYDNVIDKLEHYGITADQIKAEWNEYFSYCCEHDLF